MRLKWIVTGVLGVGSLVVSGCGTPGAPQPPSLHLPQRVADLSAVRAGNQVTLMWTSPRRDTDKVALGGNVTAAICRVEGQGRGLCVAAGTVSIVPGAKGQFVDSLPAGLAAGVPRGLSYFVELKNKHGRSAGESNAAVVLAGEAPAAVVGFAAELHKDGVAMRWAAGDGGQAVRLYRKLLTAPVKKKETGPLAAPKEQTEQRLLVDSDSGRALDKAVNYGESYEYRAQRVARVTVDGQLIELPGEISAPVRVDVQDVFPPAMPSGLAAVATPASGATAAAIDLNWLPVTDRNLAGYVVYRSEGQNGSSAEWVRVSPDKPVVGPAFHDAAVQAGHTYRYAVSSVSLTGHESKRSDEAEESIPSN